MGMVYFLGLEDRLDLPAPEQRTGEVWLELIQAKPSELSDASFVYQFGTWERGKLIEQTPFNDAKFPWEEEPESPDVKAAFDVLRKVVSFACTEGLNPRLLSFWDHDQTEGIRIHRVMSPLNLSPTRDVFDDTFGSGQLNPCTIVTFDFEISSPRVKNVL